MDPQQPPQQPVPQGQPPVTWQTPPEELGPAPGIRFASPASRLIAYVLDTIIVAVAFLALFTIGGIALAGSSTNGEVNGAGAGLFTLLVLVGIVVAFLYFPFFWARGGQTPGMKPFRIRVVRDRDGGPVTAGSALLRLLGYYINGISLYIGFAWILVDKRRRGWHDLIAGTVVIEDPR